MLARPSPTARPALFNPHEIVREWLSTQPDSAERYRDAIAGYDNGKLVERNEYYFRQSFDEVLTIRMLWLINLELTRRGIAPAWRRIPERVPGRVESRSSAPDSEVSPGLTPTLKRNLMRRWIDLEWLRLELGPQHKTEFRKWRLAFHENIDLAMNWFAQINKLVSHGGGRLGPKTPYQVLTSLSVPPSHILALTGLVNRDEGERRQNVRKRVEERYRPRLEALLGRGKYPLTQEDVARRLIYCEAIELARGSPTDAARIVGWMTGQAVTRQTAAVMRKRIAEQCGLSTQYWRPLRAGKQQVSRDSNPL